jgi:predicted PurR-regulated permease PerM
VKRGAEGRVILAAAIVVAVLIYFLQPVLLPFAAGAAIAYLLDPIVGRLQRLGLARSAATAILLVAFFAMFVAVVALLLPVMERQLVRLFAVLPDILARLQSAAVTRLERFGVSLEPLDRAAIEQAARSHAREALRWGGAILSGMWAGGTALLGVLSLLLITPVSAFYLLRDWPRLLAQIDSLLPRGRAEAVRARAREIDRTLAGFVRGQVAVCLALAMIYGVGLSIVGLEFGLLVGLSAGALSVIPYLGVIVGLVVAVALALFQFESWQGLMGVAAVFAVGQVLESVVLTPRLVGESVGLHPIWIVFSILAGGTLFGFLGLLLAVPAAAAGGVLIRAAVAHYRTTSFYSGEPTK